HVSSKEEVVVPMMSRRGRFRTGSFGGFSALEMDYAGRGVSLMILLPRDVEGLNQLERLLTAEAVEEWRALLREKPIEVYLPKFKVTSKFELAGVLQQMGMRLPFTGGADFS